MTGVLENTILDRGPSILAAPRPGPHGGIVDRELVPQGLVVGPRETLHDVQVPAGSQRVLVAEVGRIDDQCVALPPTNGITEPLADLRPRVPRLSDLVSMLIA